MNLDDVLDHLLGTTNQAPPGAAPDKQTHNYNIKQANLVHKGKADRMPRMNVQKSVERDLGLQVPHVKMENTGGVMKVGVVENAMYGLRKDGTPKGEGFYGKQQSQDPRARPGSFSTELSTSSNVGGKELFYPLMAPGLNQGELDSLLRGDKPSNAIYDKAVTSAQARQKQGKSAFAGPGEQMLTPRAGAVAAEVKHRELLSLFKELSGGGMGVLP